MPHSPYVNISAGFKYKIVVSNDPKGMKYLALFSPAKSIHTILPQVEQTYCLCSFKQSSAPFKGVTLGYSL